MLTEDLDGSRHITSAQTTRALQHPKLYHNGKELNTTGPFIIIVNLRTVPYFTN